jgi:CheY-like chemotaxis protein
MIDQNTTVLVVDDHDPSRNLLCEVLTSAGYAVRAASDGLNAIRHMEETRFDVVLTDVAMPQMDGLELLTKIRDRWPDSRVVVHSNLLTWRVARLAKGWRGHMPASPNPPTLLSSSKQ